MAASRTVPDTQIDHRPSRSTMLVVAYSGIASQAAARMKCFRPCDHEASGTVRAGRARSPAPSHRFPGATHGSSQGDERTVGERRRAGGVLRLRLAPIVE